MPIAARARAALLAGVLLAACAPEHTVITALPGAAVEPPSATAPAPAPAAGPAPRIVALLTDRSGVYRDIGAGLLAGCQAAFEQHNRTAAPHEQFELAALDSAGAAAQAGEAARLLLDGLQVEAVLAGGDPVLAPVLGALLRDRRVASASVWGGVLDPRAGLMRDGPDWTAEADAIVRCMRADRRPDRAIAVLGGFDHYGRACTETLVASLRAGVPDRPVLHCVFDVDQAGAVQAAEWLAMFAPPEHDLVVAMPALVAAHLLWNLPPRDARLVYCTSLADPATLRELTGPIGDGVRVVQHEIDLPAAAELQGSASRMSFAATHTMLQRLLGKAPAGRRDAARDQVRVLAIAGNGLRPLAEVRR